MIRVDDPIPEPASFQERCAVRGMDWLRLNPVSKKMPSYWTEFQPELADGFENRCGWWAMYIADGAVDHFLSRENHRHLAYNWGNYRYIAGTVNSSKKALDDQVLDPFEIMDGWFEVLLPSLQLVSTGALPAALAAKAAFTLETLHLQNGAKVRRTRLNWYEGFKAGRITMSGLDQYAPLIASAVRKWLDGDSGPLP